jgi:hypothetical protein
LLLRWPAAATLAVLCLCAPIDDRRAFGITVQNKARMMRKDQI